jgi:hypothetical protein
MWSVLTQVQGSEHAVQELISTSTLGEARLLLSVKTVPGWPGMSLG